MTWRADEHVVEVQRFYGKFEGVVTKVDDPLDIGRVRARVPAVLGEDVESGWAMPCVPFGGGLDRGCLIVPDEGDTVWIEFAGGDPGRPIWTGTFWGAPTSAGGQDDLSKQTGPETPEYGGRKAGPGHGVIKTSGGHTISFDDDGGVLIVSAADHEAEVHLSSSGEVVIHATAIKLGENATESLVKGNAFMTLFNAHTHPTGVGPSGPPAKPMTPSELSSLSSTE